MQIRPLYERYILTARSRRKFRLLAAAVVQISSRYAFNYAVNYGDVISGRTLRFVVSPISRFIESPELLICDNVLRRSVQAKRNKQGLTRKLHIKKEKYNLVLNGILL